MSAQLLTVMLVAAEASGDILGAGLARALQARLDGQVRFIGVGGPRMAEAGVESPFDIAELSVLGFVEGVAAYRRVVARADETAALALREKPDVAVLIDSWGFTLRVATRLRKALPGLPLIKYVAPQVWASRPGRARTLARTVDHLLSINGLDAPHFARAGLPTTFVGAPALARDFSDADPGRLRTRLCAAADDPILLVLPGSRPAEIARLGPVFGDAVRRLAAERPDLRVVLPVAETVAAAVRAEVAHWNAPVTLIEDDAGKTDAFAAATVALACSGTVTTELALAGRPMVVAYKLGWLTYRLIKLIATARYATLFNIAADREVAPEFLQDACTGPALARAIAERLDDPELRRRQVEAQNAALEKLGRGVADPAERAAEVVLEVVQARGKFLCAGKSLSPAP